MVYYLCTSPQGETVGAVQYEMAPDPMPGNYYACTEAQYLAPQFYKVVSGVVVENVASAQATQSGIISAACSAAESAPLSFTNEAGTAGVFPMDSSKLSKYLGAYAKYSVKGIAFPNGASTYNFYDVNGKAVAMSLTDIENFFNAVETQIDGALAKQETLLTDIATAAAVSAVQAVVW